MKRERQRKEVGKLTPTNSLYNLRQHLQTPNSPIHLSPRMVRNDDPLTAILERFERVFGALDTFDDERTTIRDALPLYMHIVRLDTMENIGVGEQRQTVMVGKHTPP